MFEMASKAQLPNMQPCFLLSIRKMTTFLLSKEMSQDLLMKVVVDLYGYVLMVLQP